MTRLQTKKNHTSLYQVTSSCRGLIPCPLSGLLSKTEWPAPYPPCFVTKCQSLDTFSDEISSNPVWYGTYLYIRGIRVIGGGQGGWWGVAERAPKQAIPKHVLCLCPQTRLRNHTAVYIYYHFKLKITCLLPFSKQTTKHRTL